MRNKFISIKARNYEGSNFKKLFKEACKRIYVSNAPLEQKKYELKVEVAKAWNELLSKVGFPFTAIINPSNNQLVIKSNVL